MKLFATMCNQPQRLLEALAPARAALIAAPPIARWGLGYVQSGEVLLARTPRPSATPIDLYAAMEGVKSDCVLGHAVRDLRRSADASPNFGGTDDTPPFRYRRWMYVQDIGVPPSNDGSRARPLEGGPALAAALAPQVPDYLRRNIKGQGTGELAFHVFLAMLHDVGGIDDANLPVATTRRALAAASALVASELTKLGGGVTLGNVAVSNGRSLLVARIGSPLWMRRLHVMSERGGKDEQFRGVLLVSSGVSDPSVASDGFEEIPESSVVLVTRDLRVDVTPMTA